MEEKIKDILKNGNEIIDIKKLGNSYSSNVYLITLKNKKYIFKILKSNEKRKVEAHALRYLKRYMNVPKLVKTGVSDNIYYNIMEFVEGISYEDKDAKKLKKDQLIIIGKMLATLHTVKLINNDDLWYDYLLWRIETANESLKNHLKGNKSIYLSLLKQLNNEIKNNYSLATLHMGFRLGNIIINDKIYLIDFESVKNGDPAFDFIKIKRLLSEKQFKEIVEEYKKNKDLPIDFEKRLDFYNFFDAYTALDWCILNNQVDSEYYKLNIRELKKYEKRKF